MKKKILIIVVVIIVVIGGVVAALALTGGGVTEEDNAQGEDTHENVEEIYKDPNATVKPESNMADTTANNLEEQLGIDEEFDLNDI